MTESGPASDKAALDKFLADNPELETLAARLSTFNVFRALRIDHEEIRHSNTMAWLIDPQESHGLDDIVLRRLLSNILLGAGTERSESLGISAAQVELMDLTDVEVRREWQNIDLMVVIRQPSGKGVVLIIENKIHSGLGKGQLNRYIDRVSREFPSFVLVPVLLTLTGEDADKNQAGTFIAYSHRQILSVLEKAVGLRREQLASAVSVFLDHYMETLRGLTMQDKDLIGLCKKIYRTHRKAIDLIVEYGRASKFEEVANEMLKKEGSFEVLSSSPVAIWFLPDAWARVLPENGTVWTHLSRRVSVACWMSQYTDNKIHIVFEVSRMKDPKKRLACVTALHKAGFRLAKKAFREDATFSRFFSASQEVDDFDDEENIRKALGVLLAKAREQLPKAAVVLAEVFSGI